MKNKNKKEGLRTIINFDFLHDFKYFLCPLDCLKSLIHIYEKNEK